METIRIVFYHTKEILKGRALRVYAALFLISMIVMLYMEGLQLAMDVDGMLYMVISVLLSIVNMVITYIVVFLFIKAVRKERFTMQDVRYGIAKAPTFIVMGLLLSILQIVFLSLSAFVSGIYPLYLLLYTLIYTFFVMWNGVVAFGVYDNASFGEVFTSGIRIMKDHVGEIFAAALLFLLWKMSTQLLVPYLINEVLGNTMYAGLIIPSIIKGASVSTAALMASLAINVIYYAVQYACLLPVYTYLAKLYDENKTRYVPSVKQITTHDKKRIK